MCIPALAGLRVQAYPLGATLAVVFVWRAWMESNHRLDVRSVVSCPLNDRRLRCRLPVVRQPRNMAAG